MADPGTGKRDALERQRRMQRMRGLIATLAVGALLGGGVVQLAVLLSTTSAPGPEPDRWPPGIAAVEPEEGRVLTAGTASFRLTFTEPLAASPSVALVGPRNLTVPEVSFDGRSWRGDVAIEPGADGRYDLEVRDVADANGNRAGTLSYAYVIDTAPPTARASVVANATSEPFDVAWDADDGAGSGVARVELRWRTDGGPWSVLTTSSSDRGAYRVDPGVRKATFDFHAVAVDGAGNREPGAPTPEATVRYNAVPPSASLLPVRPYWFRGPTAMSAIAGPNVTAVDLRYHFAPDNATWQGPFSFGTARGPYAWTFDFPLGPGYYRLYARAEDGEGASEEEQGPGAAEAILGYDVDPPASQLAPVSPFWHAQPIVLSANGTDDRSGMAAMDLMYAYRQNGTAPWSGWTLAATVTSPPWSFAFDFPRGDGRYAFSTRATDRTGNREALPTPADADASVGFDRDAPAVPFLALPRFVDPAAREANVTWVDEPAADVVRYEVHRGTSPAFVPDGGACVPGTTCVAEAGRSARAAWAPLPAENATYWFRVRAEDDGGLGATSASVGAVFHGRGFDSANTYAMAGALPVNVAWAERIDYAGGCGDCTDIFKITLNAGDVLTLQLAVPPTGDFRLLVLDAGYAQVAKSDVRGWGAWESLAVDILKAGVYYVVVDWAGVGGTGRNEGWYTLGALVS